MQWCPDFVGYSGFRSV